jgi:hypothetical protein
MLSDSPKDNAQDLYKKHLYKKQSTFARIISPAKPFGSDAVTNSFGHLVRKYTALPMLAASSTFMICGAHSHNLMLVSDVVFSACSVT